MKELDVEELVKELKSLANMWQQQDERVGLIANEIDRKLGVVIEQIAAAVSKAHKEVEP